MKKFISYSLVVATLVWTLGVAAVAPASAAVPADGSVIKVKGGVDIYYVEGGQKHRFLNPTVLKSWYFKSDAASSAGVDFAKVGLKEVEAADFNALPTGSDVTVRPGTFLVQFGLATAIYAVGPSAELYKVDSPATAAKLFGSNWGKKVVVFPSNYNNVNRYGPVAGTLTSSSKLPDGSLVKFTGDDKTYVITGGQKQEVTAEGFIANGLNSAFVKTASNPADYATVSGAITGVSSMLSTRAIAANVPVSTGAVKVSLASNSPASASVPQTASRVPFAKVNLTASNDGTATVESITVKRSGLSSYSAFAKVWAEKDGMTVASKRAMSSNDEVILTFDPVLSIPAGQTVSVDILAELSSATGNAALGVTAMTGSGSASGLPVTGNLMTFVNYSVTGLTLTRALNSSSTVSVGDEDVELGQVNVAFSTNTRDVILSSLTLKNTQAEELSKTLMNVYLEHNGERVSSNGVIDGRYITFNFNSGYTMSDDDSDLTFSIKADVIGRESTGVLDLRLNKKTDFSAYEKATGFGVTPTSDEDVLINGIQIESGLVTVSKKATSPSDTTVVKGTNGQVVLLANIKADEAINADGLKVKYSASDLTSFQNVKVYLNNVLLGSFDPSSTTTSTSELIDSPLTLNKGNNEVKVTVDVKSTASSNATFNAQLDGPSFALLDTPEYVSNGNAVDAGDISGTATGAVITAGAGSMTVVRNDGYATDRPAVKGSTDVSLGKFAVKAVDDSVKLTSILLSSNSGSGTPVPDSSIYDMKLFVDGVQIGSTRNFASGATFSSLNYAIAKDVTKVVELKGSFDSAATGTFKTTLTFNAVDSVGKAIDQKTATTTQTLVQDGGSVTLDLSPNTPYSSILIAPLSGQEVARYKLTALRDAISITELTLTNYGTTTPTSTAAADPRVAAYKLYVGSTMVGEGTPLDGALTVTFTTGKIVVPANGTIDLVVKADLNAIELASETNMPISLGISGVKAKGSNGSELASGSITTTPSKSNILVIRKGMPVISKLSGISSSAGATQQLGEFKIDAVGEDVELTDLTVSLNGTGSASTSDFILQEVGKSTDLATSTDGAFADFSTIISKGTSKTYRVFANTASVATDKTFGISISGSADTNAIAWNEYFVDGGFTGAYDSSWIMSSAIDFGTMKY